MEFIRQWKALEDWPHMEMVIRRGQRRIKTEFVCHHIPRSTEEIKWTRLFYFIMRLKIYKIKKYSSFDSKEMRQKRRVGCDLMHNWTIAPWCEIGSQWVSCSLLYETELSLYPWDCYKGKIKTLTINRNFTK